MIWGLSTGSDTRQGWLSRCQLPAGSNLADVLVRYTGLLQGEDACENDVLCPEEGQCI